MIGILRMEEMAEEKGSFDFSVAMSVYQKDQPRHFERALDSVIKQTLPPREIVIVLDGPVGGEVTDIIRDRAEKHRERIAIRTISFSLGKSPGTGFKSRGGALPL